ncbi:hypothetical protein [Streptomyces caniferus]|uniref:hypothetical protein n=1 Tax=Streptomyces caniferus TaxID=285557 RepID=UPI0037F54FEE
MAPLYDVTVLGLGFGLGGTGSAVAHQAGAHPAGKAATCRYAHTPDEHWVPTAHPIELFDPRRPAAAAA